MRRLVIVSALAALSLALPVAEALAGDGCCRQGRRAYAGHGYGPRYVYRRPPNPYAAWRAYYGEQAEIAAARRAATANWYIATGRAPPRRYYGPPTNYYAEHYALHPYAYFNCPQARRGEGICANPDFFPQ